MTGHKKCTGARYTAGEHQSAEWKKEQVSHGRYSCLKSIITAPFDKLFLGTLILDVFSGDVNKVIAGLTISQTRTSHLTCFQ